MIILLNVNIIVSETNMWSFWSFRQAAHGMGTDTMLLLIPSLGLSFINSLIDFDQNCVRGKKRLQYE